MREAKRVAGTLLSVFAAGALMALPIAAEASTGKNSRGAKLSVRLKTVGQAKALRTKKLKVRVVSRRAARVRVRAKLARNGKRIAKRKTVRLKPSKRRVVKLRLNKHGRRVLARCAPRRVKILARGLAPRWRMKTRRIRKLRPDPGRCPPVAPDLPGCAARNAPGGEWPFYSGTPDGHREQVEEKSIDTGNVSQLGVAWRTAAPDGGVIHSTPTVADGCVYTGTDLGNVHALNADTGEVVWSRSLGGSDEGSSTFQGAGIVGAPAVARGLVYVGATTPDASVLSALDQATGEIVWQRVVDEDEGGGLDSSPVPFKGMVLQAFKGD